MMVSHSSEDETVTPKKRSTSQSPRSSQKKKRSANKSYCPKPGSGGYAILIALYNNRDKEFMSKAELCDAAEEYSTESMTRPAPGAGQYHTGWSSSTTLVKKGLIIKWSNPCKIKLSDAGEELAEKIVQNRNVANAVLGDGARNNPSDDNGLPTQPDITNFRLQSIPRQWKVQKRGKTNPRSFARR